MCPKTIIEGVTPKGEKFRPSNWAEMVAGTMQNRRLHYSPLLRPTISKKTGNKCLIVDHALKESNPELYDHIMEFATKNDLRICNEDEV